MGRLQTTCNGQYGSKYNLYLDYSVDSPPDIANNRSYVRLSMWAQSSSSTYGAFNNYDNVNFYNITINGSNVVSGSKRMDFRNTAVVSLGSYEGWVNHNADGSLTITIGGSFSLANVSTLTGGSISGSWTLPTIPRASTISSFPNFEVNASVAVTIDRKVADFTHTLQLYFGSTFIGERTGIGAGTTLTLTQAEQDAIYALMPSSITATVTLYCRTFNSSGTAIGDWTSVTATITVPSTIVPSFTSVTAAETATFTINGTATNLNTIVGKYVQLLSKIKIDITGATTSKGTDVTKLAYKITVDGVDFNLASVTVGSINKSGDITVTGTVTDTRGRSASKSITINLLAYAPPEITEFDVTRSNSNGTANAIGTYAKVVTSAKVSSLLNGTTQKNSLTYKLYSKLRGTTDWGTPKKTLTPVAISVTSVADILGDGSALIYGAASSYDFRIDVVDKFNTTISLDVLSTGDVMASWAKIGMGVGKVWERGALDVKGDSYFEGNVYVNSKFALTQGDIAISQGGQSYDITGLDFNFIYNVGFYRGCNMINSPDGTADWFYTIVQKHSDAWVNQLAINFFNDRVWMRRMHNGTWQQWREVGVNMRTLSDVTYYVRNDGNDSNTGLVNSQTGAFKTIAKAITMIPPIVNHKVIIRISAGTYIEPIVLGGYHGMGSLEIIGDTPGGVPSSIIAGYVSPDLNWGDWPAAWLSSGYSKCQILLNSINVPIRIQGLNVYGAVMYNAYTQTMRIVGCPSFTIDTCKFISNEAQFTSGGCRCIGVVGSSWGYIMNCIFQQAYYAVEAELGASVFVNGGTASSIKVPYRAGTMGKIVRAGGLSYTIAQTSVTADGVVISY